MSLPWLGAGVAWRPGVAAGAAVHELMPEHVLAAPPHERALLLAEATRAPVVAHSVSMSLGSAEGPDEDFLRRMHDVCDASGAPWASDHLCFTRHEGRALGQLVPIPYTDESLDVVARNVRLAQSILGRPLALENVTRALTYEADAYEEPEFFRRLCAESGCFVLLDTTNAWINAGGDLERAQAYVDAMPLERVIHLHLGGADGLLDTHAAPVPEPAWALAERALQRAPARALILEREARVDEKELERASLLMEAHRP